MTKISDDPSVQSSAQIELMSRHTQEAPFDWSLLDGRPIKHSLTLKGHRTSVSLEPSFWVAFKSIAKTQGVSLNGLAMSIDENRGDIGLASAIRLYTLHQIMSDQVK